MYLLIITRSIHNFLIQACIQFNNHINEDTFISFFFLGYHFWPQHYLHNIILAPIPTLSYFSYLLLIGWFNTFYHTLLLHMHLILTTNTFTPLFSVGTRLSFSNLSQIIHLLYTFKVVFSIQAITH